MRKFILASDLDNTWIGDNPATIELQKRLMSIRDDLYLVYATGRSVGSVAQLMRDFWLTTGEKMLVPDYLITSVGSEIYNQGVMDYEWASKICLNWNRNAIDTITQAFPQLIPQPHREQNPWKLSFYLEDTPNTLEVIASVQQSIILHNLQANLIYSSHKDLDIVPSQVNKGLALTHITNLLRLPPSSTIVCGDSGNDISLFEHSYRGIIVSNAQPELSQWHYTDGQSQHYVAQLPYAQGILEGLHHFGVM